MPTKFLHSDQIPQPVIEEAKELIDMYGERISYLGKIKDGRDAYCFTFPDEEETGYPFVYLYDEHIVMEISGLDALDVIDSLYVK